MEITPEIITAFRVAQPEFTDAGLWPDVTVTMALCEGDAETGGKGWGGYDSTNCQNFKARGLYLYAAHFLKSAYPQGAVCADDVKSGAKLVVSSKSVGDESISFDTSAFSKMSTGDAWLATTAYGQQWMRLRRRAGMGARTSGENAVIVRQGLLSTGLC